MTGRQLGRRPWLGRLEERLHELGGDEFVHGLWWAVYEQLCEDGMHGSVASPIALRCAKLAAYLLDGTEQRAAARALEVSERTAKLDAARLRRVVASGALTWNAGRQRRAA